MNAIASKIAISIDSSLLDRLDAFIQKKHFKNRSQAIQSAVEEVVGRLEHSRLAEECSKLDSAYERQLADEWQDIEGEEEWSKY